MESVLERHGKFPPLRFGTIEKWCSKEAHFFPLENSEGALEIVLTQRIPVSTPTLSINPIVD